MLTYIFFSERDLVWDLIGDNILQKHAISEFPSAFFVQSIPPPKKKHSAGATQTAGRTMPTKFCRALDVIEFLHVS